MVTEKDIKFYNKNGYLVLRNIIDTNKIDELEFQYKELKSKLAFNASISLQDYNREISQIRDLWKFNNTYKELILNEEISKIAPSFFNDNSCRLLHDHIINKPKGNNGIVPWHQDYTYWPSDKSNGLSLWLPFSDLDKNSGVLEVIPKSHNWAEEKPIDFMNDSKAFECGDIEYLTVNKGDIVVLHSLTWHRTSNNTSIPERIAYISLWIDSNSKYAPKHANWHPVNDNVTIKENENFNEDWFPVLGNYSRNNLNHDYVDNSLNTDNKNYSMFNASKITKKFLTTHLNICESSVWKSLYDKKIREKSVQELILKFNLEKDLFEKLDGIILSLAINGLAYKNHRGRNIYNKSYVEFKRIFHKEF